MDEQKKSELEALRARASEESSNVAAIIREMLEKYDAELWPHAKRELNYELNGFTDSTEYYLKAPREKSHQGYIPTKTAVYRERDGRLFVSKPDGTRADVQHEFGQRKAFYVSTPIGRLQELAEDGDEEVVVDMPELTALIGKEEGDIKMLCARKDVQQMVEVMRRGIGVIMNHMLHPELNEENDEYLRIKREQRAAKSEP